MRLRRIGAVGILVLFGAVPGCLDADPVSAGSPECPVHPDGAPACTPGEILAAEGEPDALSGWRCARENEHLGQLFELWLHPSGRFGAAWDLDLEDEAATHWFRLAVLTAPDEGRAVYVDVPRTSQGFVTFPEPLPEQGNIDVHLSIRSFRMWVENGSDFDPIVKPDVVPSAFGGVDWYVAAVPGEAGIHYIDLMEPHLDDHQYQQWRPVQEITATVDGMAYMVDQWVAGTKFNNQDAASMRRSASVCPGLA